MEYNFTFKTDVELLLAESNNPDMLFNIVRVVVEKPNRIIFDFPIKSEEEFNTYKSKLSFSNDKLIQIYSAVHGFENKMAFDFCE